MTGLLSLNRFKLTNTACISEEQGMIRQANATAFLLLLFAVAPGPARALGPNVLFPGHSGIWYDPARDGEGYVLELISPTAATLTWFTYDENGNQRWLFGVGQITRTQAEGAFVTFPEMFDTSGGVFGDDFDPSRVVRRLVGSARIAFDSCSSGRFTYAAYGASGSVPVQRVATSMGLDCAPVHGQAAAAFEAYAGESGSWYDPSHDGEGYQLQWTSGGQALLTWYSYDAAGKQYWMTGVGVRDSDGRIVFDSLQATEGARFGPDFDSSDVERYHWGSLTLDLTCATGEAVYTSELPGFGGGSQTLSRITALLKSGCPRQLMALTELYDVSLRRLPTSLPSDGLPKYVQAFSIADDGTVIGAHPNDGAFQLLRLPADGTEWEPMTDHTLAAAPFQITPSADTILANEAGSSIEAFSPLLWDPARGWRPLNGIIFHENYARAGSPNLKHVVGTGSPPGDPSSYPWIWSESTGQVEMPKTDEIRLPVPLAVSNSGETVVGYSLSPNRNGFMDASGIRWDGPLNEPEYLSDALGARLGAATACSTHCDVIYGAGHFDPDADYPYRDRAWVIASNGAVHYLDGSAGFTSLGAPSPRATTADGSMAAGTFSAGTPQGNSISNPFLWTRVTGLVGLREVSISLDDTIEKWDDMRVMDMSSDGALLLLLGEETLGGASPTAFHAAILRLRPLEVDDSPTNMGN